MSNDSILLLCILYYHHRLGKRRLMHLETCHRPFWTGYWKVKREAASKRGREFGQAALPVRKSEHTEKTGARV